MSDGTCGWTLRSDEPEDQVTGQSRRRKLYDTDEEARGRSIAMVDLGASSAEDRDTEWDIDPLESTQRSTTNQDRWSIDSDGVNVPGESNRDVEVEERIQTILCQYNES